MNAIQVPYVVLGAGAMGAAAAYQLARRGERVLLVEQFHAGHDRGSSHGAARIIRHSYADPNYARLMPAAFAAWRDLEADAGLPLMVRTGGVSLCPPGVDYVARVAASLEGLGVPHRRMSGRDLRRALPVFAVPDDYEAVFEPDAGLVRAARAVALQIELALRLGGERVRLLEGCPIRRLDLEAGRPVLVADDLQIRADRLIVAAGPWTARLLPDLPVPLRPTRQQVCYFRPEDPAPFAIGRFPAWIFMGETADRAFYGMPDFEVGVKAAGHGGPVVDPETVDRTPRAADEEVVRDLLRDLLPTLADAPLGLAEICLYTMAPDECFCLGPLPGRPDVIVASPCSGHGFKFSALIGRILADLAQGGTTELAIDAWRPGPPAS